MVLEAAGSSPVSHPSQASFVFAANEAFSLAFAGFVRASGIRICSSTGEFIDLLKRTFQNNGNSRFGGYVGGLTECQADYGCIERRCVVDAVAHVHRSGIARQLAHEFQRLLLRVTARSLLTPLYQQCGGLLKNKQPSPAFFANVGLFVLSPRLKWRIPDRMRVARATGCPLTAVASCRIADIVAV